MTITIDVPETRIVSAYLEAPFDLAVEELSKNGFELIDLKNNAILRKQQEKEAFCSKNGNWVKEDVIYLPDETRLSKNSIILKNAKTATECHRNGREFCPTKEQLDEAMQGSIKIKAGEIPTNRFKDDEITVYCFGDFAEEYGNFLRASEIEDIPVYLAKNEQNPFMRKLWFRSLGVRSVLDGDDRGLGYLNLARGVRVASATTAENSRDTTQVKTYTEADIRKALGKSGLSGIESILIKTLGEQ